MPTLSIRTLTHANNKAKVPTDERSQFFREQYRGHSLSFAGKKNSFGMEYLVVEGGNHHSRKALRGALQRLAESPTSPQDTEVIIIADYAFMNDGKEEEKKLEKVGEKEKLVKVEVEREGIGKLLEAFGPKFRRMTVLYEKSPEGPQDGGEFNKHMTSLFQGDERGRDHVVHVLHSQDEVTPGTYSTFVKASAGMAP